MLVFPIKKGRDMTTKSRVTLDTLALVLQHSKYDNDTKSLIKKTIEAHPDMIQALIDANNREKAPWFTAKDIISFLYLTRNNHADKQFGKRVMTILHSPTQMLRFEAATVVMSKSKALEHSYSRVAYPKPKRSSLVYPKAGKTRAYTASNPENLKRDFKLSRLELSRPRNRSPID